MKQNRNGDDFYTCLQYPGLNRYLSLFVTDLAFAKGGGGNSTFAINFDKEKESCTYQCIQFENHVNFSLLLPKIDLIISFKCI